MGLFKRRRDSREMAEGAHTKDPKPSLREGLRNAKDAMADASHQASETGLAHDPHARKGTAEIESIRDTRMTVGQDPMVEFDLAVSCGGFTYRVTHTQIINRLRVGQLQPGAVVEVRIDAEDRNSLLIV